ncbi:IS30 family transposase [Streptomyces chartreusis]|uniref:IS30 family transposase n=1 Tax=Streptomyces chartreusis TaxID=1969 RepID=UPI003F4D0E8A
MRRNSRPHDYGRYDADLAHHRWCERAGRPRRAKLATDPELKAEVQSKLDLEWSPEQIASHLRTRWPDRPERHPCHETIYRAFYRGAKESLNRTLTRKLRAGRPLGKKRRRPHQRMPRFVAPAALIDSRPPVIELRERLGDSEGDLVEGVRSQSAVATLVERRTRYLRLLPPPSGHSASHLRDALITILRPAAGASPTESHLGPGRRDGSPTRTRALLRRRHLLCPTRQSLSAGHKRTNENTNGLIRQYLLSARTCPSPRRTISAASSSG